MLKYLLPMFAITAILFLETIALLKGINGTALSLALSSIGGIAGYTIKTLRGCSKQ